MKPTATTAGIELRAGTFETICDALDYAAEGNSGVNFYHSDGRLMNSLTYGELRNNALGMAGQLAAAFARESRIGLVAETSADFVTAFMACQYAGMVPAPLSLPAAFGGRKIYERQVGQMVRQAGLAALMTPASVRDIINSALSGTSVRVVDMSGSDLPSGTALALRHGANDLSYIQFSSGCTSQPKGIVATQASVSANCRAIIQEGLQVVEGDRAVSWLPLYHDMGLVGFFIAPLYSQLSIDFLSPSDFARRPGTWLKLISENRGTLSYSPSFGYELCARRYRGEVLDLSSWRAAGIGGDMVRSEALSAFTQTFAPSGFDPSAFVSSYGLAEATLAVSFAPLRAGLRTDDIDLARMQTSGRALPASDLTFEGTARRFVSSGRPLPSLDLRIVNDNDEALGDRQVGRIIVRGPSIAAGYFRVNEPLQPLTNEDGWLETGDLGYWNEDELVITGRSKDLILWNGRNIWPQDIEGVAQEAGGRNIARSAAFDVQDENGAIKILLLAECRSRDEAVRAELRRDISAATRAATGAPVSVEFVAIRSLPTTSSGKLSRAAARIGFLAGDFVPQRQGNVVAGTLGA
ncbi:fatty acyl-AMP ligase [Hyphomonas johnsonii]|uniref:Putative AMP binding protein n=1 Tax=Hyphomonas johnsonii MHS-2 TaxID=1280950 RepID=A0A059FBH6_9PROT|nr:fatty acyl-AMP ligase [Hyphomonas johnsonii]KCZ87947.1 putative AMP binding protein [Hyphomonas johnsonii MHS-2]